jgi:hypothetical protein
MKLRRRELITLLGGAGAAWPLDPNSLETSINLLFFGAAS